MPRSWTLSPTAELDEAIAWMKRRVPVSPSELEKVKLAARRTGFWMADVATKARAGRIQKSLEDAMAHGMTFETWKRNNKNLLARLPRGVLQTTYRNWIQTSHNAAKVNYLSNPQVKKRRPYWKFEAILDGNTTQVCQACDGTVLESGHDWFLTHTPPLHHNCRSTIIGLTKTKGEAVARKRAPGSARTAPDDGFGAQVKEPWEPSTKGVPDGFKPSPRPSSKL